MFEALNCLGLAPLLCFSLCANYLLPDQQLSGMGLIAYAIVVSGALVLYLRRLPGFGFAPPEDRRVVAPRHHDAG